MPEPSKEELLKRVAELEQQLQGRKPTALEFRVSDKGAVSVYRLGRFPVTLYYEQWVRLLDHAEELRAFLEANKGKLKLKGGVGGCWRWRVVLQPHTTAPKSDAA